MIDGNFRESGWLILAAAGAFEIVFAISLKATDGLSKLGPTIITFIAMIGSFGFLSWALRYLPLGLTYAVWTSIGIFGTTLAGVFMFHEAFSPLRLVCMLAIMGGIVGIRLTS